MNALKIKVRTILYTQFTQICFQFNNNSNNNAKKYSFPACQCTQQRQTSSSVLTRNDTVHDTFHDVPYERMSSSKVRNSSKRSSIKVKSDNMMLRCNQLHPECLSASIEHTCQPSSTQRQLSISPMEAQVIVAIVQGTPHIAQALKALQG